MSGKTQRKLNTFKTGGGYFEYFKIYTCLFVIMSLFTFSWYFFTGRTLIYKGDGWTQHYRALIYYAKYLRSIIRNLVLEHQMLIPAWDFSLGEGNDILAALHYYVIGDPFSVLSVLVPTRYMYIYYNVMTLMRLYLAGAAFSALCFQCKNQNIYAVLAGAMVYVFCFWGIYNAARHPFFLNPMIYFPMVITGIEKVFNKERPYLLIIAVFLSAVSNFYFFYMIVLVTIIYVVVRVFFYCRSNIRLAIRMFFHIGILSLVGVMLAAIIILPIGYVFLNDSRMSGKIAFHLVYPLSYYSKLPALFVTEGSPYWLCMGFAAPVLPAVFLLFHKHGEYRLLKGLFLVCVLLSVFPVFGQILNGFSYMSNRWSWAFALLSAYILTTMWSSLMKLNLKDSIFLCICTISYFFVCLMLEYSRTTNAFVSIGFVFVFLLILLPVKSDTIFLNNKIKQQLAIWVVLVSIINNSFWKNADGGDDYASNGLEVWEVLENLQANEASAVVSVAASEGVDEFYRYSGRRTLTKNVGMSTGISSTQYYWSLSNPYVSRFRESTGQIENVSYNYRGYDDRTALLTLASVRYYVIPVNDDTPVPYGFTYVDTINVKRDITNDVLKTLKNELQIEDLTQEQIKVIGNTTQLKYKVYRNEYALPLTYSYDRYISTDTWDALSIVERQEALLSAVVLNDYDIDADETSIKFKNTDLEYEIICNSRDIFLYNNTVIVTSANASMTLNFEGIPNSETYFNIYGLSFKGVPEYELYFGNEEVDPLNLYNRTNWERLTYTKQEAISKRKLFWTEPTEAKLTLSMSTGISKTLSYHTNANKLYNGRHNFTINLGYVQEPITSVTVKFSEIGIYNFETMGISCQPMDSYEQQINELKKDRVKNIEISTNKLSGTISLEKAKWVCFSIPYSKGWSAYVDGKRTELYQANIKNMALDIDAGTHNIVLTYQTPLLKEGALISTATAVVLFLVILLERNKKHWF